MEKGPDAFRTISEVADDLDLPQHVLRFWESRFPQIRPLKRGGGRRYYRPDDVELLRGIRHLLYGEGYTIRGVQRILKEEGPRYVQAIWRDAEADALAASGLSEDIEDYEVDAGHPAGAREPAPRSGGLGGFFNLLPSRQRSPQREPEPEPEAEEPAPRRAARRRPEAEPDYMELPLLPDLAPQSRPARVEPQRMEAVPREAQRREAPRMEAPRAEPYSGEPRAEMPRHAPVRHEPVRHEPVRHEPVRAEPVRPRAEPPEEIGGEGRAGFPFRALTPEPEPDFEDETAYVPEPPPRPAPAPAPLRPIPVRPVEDALTREDIQRLQAALYELQECRRLLDASRKDD